MPIFKRILGGKTQRRSTSLDEALLMAKGAMPTFGVQVNNQSALNITALYAGIRILSENIASFPKSVKFMGDDGLVNDRSHPVFRLINERPNSYTNKFDFWNCIVTWLNGWGNAYAIIKWGPGGVPEALFQVHPACVRIIMVNGVKWYQVSMGDSKLSFLDGLYKDPEMLHFMLVTLDGIKGENPIIRNAMALGKNVATEKFASDFYEKGGNIRGVMEMDGHMEDDTYIQWLKHYKHSSGNFDAPLLEYGVKYKQLSVDPVAAQLIQSEVLSIQDIARMLNIPPHLLGELSHATYSNIEEQNTQFVQLTLRPMAKRLEAEIEDKLFIGRDRGRYSVKFNLDGLMRGNTQARSTYYHNAILDGYMTPNEVRDLEGLERKDGLDFFLRPLNSEKVGEDENPDKELND